MDKEVVLKIEKLNKWFGITHANVDIDFELKRGCIHGLIGENGSGKSTLTSQICGILQPTDGKMILGGKPYAPKSPVDANKNKIAMVVQELGVLGTLPAAMNMFMGNMKPFTKYGMIRLEAMKKAAKAQLLKYGFSGIPLNAMASELSIEQRKIIELVKALSIEPEIMVLDEISQALSHDNRERLYKIMADFTAKGRSIIMISHDLEETLSVCDRITVLRDGEAVTTIEKKDFDLDEIKRIMIGREMSGHYYREDTQESHSREVVLSVEHLFTKSLSDISFELHRGEILGVCGLSDGGIHDLGKAVFAKEKKQSGEIIIKNKDKNVLVKKPGDITGNKGAYLSKDRDSDGLMLAAPVAQNILVPSFKELAGPLGYISPRRARELAMRAKQDFEIKCVSVDAPVNSMSGGNKQKVNLSRWLVRDLDFVILDCPTRGVDVGVKAYIYHLLEKAAKEKNLAILLISDELPEVMGMSDRLLVMKNGKISAVLSRSEGFSENKIVEVMI